MAYKSKSRKNRLGDTPAKEKIDMGRRRVSTSTSINKSGQKRYGNNTPIKTSKKGTHRRNPYKALS